MPSRTTSLLLRALVVPTAAALVLTGCSGDEKAAPKPSATTASPEKLVETSPVTGEALPDGQPDHPVFVVKIENTANGAPQYALDQADLVVEELVEGGLTRLAALYYSELPKKVGHVRSMRATDIAIAAPVAGQVVASGGAGGTYKRFEKADITLFSEDRGAPAFSSDTAKSRPYNRLVDLAALAKKAEPAQIPGPYLDWTPVEGSAGAQDSEESAAPDASATPVAPEPASKASVRFSRSSTTQWALDDGQWVRTNGHAEKEFRADTLVVMFAKVGDAGYTDPAGNPVPETDMEGSGRAVLLTADGALETTWTKDDKDSTISFATEDGSPVTVDPGKTWIELVPEGDGAIDVG